ncbi:MAE_28990/MAE_18760 family HEPN-like nuclease [Dolichospermum sp. ST_con]|nr:MAE_28990/MAE_18760 family HEPN-like nuclease [Dolichospermum sp. ST_con]MDD1419868.1 MAE_28990/MAE_18760 family HEPN-like nuclease [Dolichospermum sp. ST_sed1]MDD1423980.1 MAE_28990/MAE_18760 family HEPN-like nuclease [Dolichospermum sp. ST_sed9]MDD1430504.1 MAE_28990/MAE_18760 family HEPN-like nuclease [Dolichospermum sp. ST_sed6]MDD1436966.1 MAE_28990/MAE_18760 family HEPN-like nuclease [Dolichospermum sp. ST_sed10]MDD1439905.1 MAE_28990/MAE_18760 family HEPN-like nuclease [Dolichospermu
MNQSILAHRRRIDNLFEKVACFTEPAIQSEWSKYLCILVSGFIEESLRVLLEQYCKDKASPNIQKFVTKQIEDITNCNTEKIKKILEKFSSDWQSGFTNKIQEESKINDEIKNAIDSVVQNRHKIAHGKSIGMTYSNISDYYKNVKKAVEILEEIIK